MRIPLLCFIGMILLVARPARAYDPEFAKIISYSQLMKLSPQRQAEYVRQVRFMITEFEETQKAFADDSNAVADSTERNLFLDMMIRDAEAMGAGPGSANFARGASRPRTSTFSADMAAAAYPCPTSITRGTPNINRRVRENGAKLACVNRLFAGCPGGMTEIASYGFRRVCYKVGLSDREVQRRRAAAQAQALAKTQPVKSVTPATPAKPRTPATARPRRSTNTQTQPRRTQRRSPSTNPEAPSTQEQAPEDVDGIGDADAIRDSDDEGTTADSDTHDTRLNLPPFTVDEGVIIPITAVNELIQGDDRNLCADSIKAEVDPATCNPETVAEARRKYYTTTAPHCLFGGNLQHYSDKVKRPGRCQHPREFCLSRVSCRDPDGSLATNERVVIKCADSKMILCNPLLFNLDKESKALCIPPTRDATSECNKRADEVKASLESENKPYIPFVSRLRMPTSGNQTVAEASLAGIKEAWDGYATEMNKICNDSPSKDLYCRECAIMKKRAVTLNLLMLKNPLPRPDGAGNKPNCYDFNIMETKPIQPGTGNGATSGNAERAQ